MIPKDAHRYWLLPPANEVCEGYVFTGVCHSVHRGGVCGCSGGCAWLLGGHAWLLWGACMVARGACMVARGACMVAPRGACMVALGACVVAPRGACVVALGGHAWLLLGGMHGCSGGACMVFLMRYGQWAGGTHPTGMHTCIKKFLSSSLFHRFCSHNLSTSKPVGFMQSCCAVLFCQKNAQIIIIIIISRSKMASSCLIYQTFSCY